MLGSSNWIVVLHRLQALGVFDCVRVYATLNLFEILEKLFIQLVAEGYLCFKTGTIDSCSMGQDRPKAALYNIIRMSLYPSVLITRVNCKLTHLKVPALKHSGLMLLTEKAISFGLTTSSGYNIDRLAS